MFALKSAAVLAVVSAAFCSVCDAQSTVEGPISGKLTLAGTTTFDLSSVGYQQNEYFISGTANSYSSSIPLSSDGKWTVQVASQAPFKTRIVAYTPVDPMKFNGTV